MNIFEDFLGEINDLRIELIQFNFNFIHVANL